MKKPLSIALCQRLGAAVDGRMILRATAKRFGVAAPPTMVKLGRQLRLAGYIEPQP